MSSKKDSSDYKCSLRPETLEKAKRELNEDPSTRLLEVKTLRTRLEKVPGLMSRTDVPFLLKFLRARKFDQERAFQLVKNCYAARRENPDLYEDMKPSRVKLVMDAGLFEVLENRSKDGCRVIICRAGIWDVDSYTITTIIQALYLVLMNEAQDEETQVHGIQLIGQFKQFGWHQGTHITPGIGMKAFRMLQDVVPLRLKRLDYVQEPTFFDIIFAIVKPFIKEKLNKRIGFHGDNFEALHTMISPEHLPTDLGGKIPVNSKYNQAWISKFLASDTQFEEDNKFGFVDMGLNGGDAVSKSGDAGLAGLGGTFKKLEI